jgi:8-oxo-dGTP pyrophosphatase MutT (NUDIX family)
MFISQREAFSSTSPKLQCSGRMPNSDYPLKSDSRVASVIDLLNGYIPSTPEESQHLTDILNLLALEKPLDRGSFVPGHITASAVIVDRKARSILLIQHKKLNRWLQPGGHVEPEDRCLVAAAIREVHEEVGLQLSESEARLLDVDVHEIPSTGKDPVHLHFDVRFLFFCPETELRAASDTTDACWFPLQSAGKYFTGSDAERVLAKCAAATAECR